MAMLRIVPSPAVIEQLIQRADDVWAEDRAHNGMRLWLAAAAPVWFDASPQVLPFLQACSESENEVLADTAPKH